MNGVWQEESEIFPADVTSGHWFGNSVAISGDTAIIGSPCDCYMGMNSGTIYVFARRYGETWEEGKKLTPLYGVDYDWCGSSVSISGNTAIIGTRYDNERGDDS